MNKIRLSQVFVFALFLSLTACTPSKFNALIVGTWQPVKLGTLDIQQNNSEGDTTSGIPYLQNNRVLDLLKQSVLETKEKGMTTEDVLEQVKKTIDEPRVVYTFAAKGKGIRIVPGGEPMQGTWKFKNRGKLLVLTDKKNGQSFKLSIDTLTSSKMVVRNVNLPKEMRVTYIKQ